MRPISAPERMTLPGVEAVVWQGAGPGQMVLLHGFSGHPLAWQEVVARLALPGLVLAPFLPGHGPPLPGPLPGSFGDAVRGLAHAVSARRSGRWRLAGYSLGARLAFGMLVESPELWSDAVLIGLNPGLDGEKERRARRAEDAARAAVLRQEGVAAFVDNWERLPLFDSQRALSTECLAIQRQQRLAHDAAGLAWSLDVLGLGAMPSYWPCLPQISSRVLLVAGELDHRFAEIVRRAAAMLPQGMCEMVPGVGHNAVLEAPETVARLLEAGVACDRAEPEEGS